MSDTALPAETAPAPPPRRRWRGGLFFLAKILVGLLAALLLLVAAAGVLIDTDAGHRFLADRIAALTPRSGLDIRIGRIEGSIWGKTQLRDVRLYDPEGLFVESPLIKVDWQPLGWITNRLLIDELTADLVIFHKRPRLRPSDEPQPILPGFDIRIGKLEIEQLRFEPALAGKRQAARVAGSIDIRSGRALINLNADVRGAGDRLRLLLDAEPDRDNFDIDVDLAAPANSVIGALVGTQRPIQLRIKGDGTWKRWAGTATLDLSGLRTADLALNAASGVYSLSGQAMPSPFLKGKGQRLTAPRVLLNGQATLADRRLDTRLSLRTAALKLESKGVLDLATSSFDDFLIGVDLLDPKALFPNMSGRAIRFTTSLNGPFGTAEFAYRLTSPRIAFDATGLEDVRAEGKGRWSKAPISVPLRFSARRVTGLGDVAGGILGNITVQGLLKVTPQRLTGDGLTLSSDKLKGKLSILVDLVTGQYTVVLSGGLTRYLIPGIGIVDVTSELRVVPGPGGRGTMVTGKGRAWVRRFDNKFFAGLAGGLPVIETDLARGADLVLHFRNLRLTAPGIRITGDGYRRRDGTFFFDGTGAQQQYGAFAMNLDGDISRPKIALRLERPMDSLGLADVLLNLDPTAEGFNYRAEGGSTIGAFTSNGAILLPSGAPATIRVARLDVSGVTASGSLRSDPGGFSGRLDLAGGVVEGPLLFSPAGDIQRIEAHLALREAKFTGPTPIAVRAGRVDGVLLLDPAGTSIEGTANARGISSGALSLANLSAEAKLRGGVGQVSATFAGTRGRNFSFQTVADLAPGRVQLTGKGVIDRRPVALAEPAVFTKVDDGWRLAPTELHFAGGEARVSGLFTSVSSNFDAQMASMPLTILDIGWPNLGLGGIASGNVSYRAPREGAPSGSLDMRVRGLTRAGLVLSSKPVDIGVTARLNGSAAAMRAVAVSEGRTIGRAQARLAPVGGAGNLGERLMRAPLFAQLRYNGPADTLWRLTGLELLDVSGPVAIGADATGTLEDPEIRGSIRAEQARIESAVTGTVIQNVKASGRFGGSRMVLDSFSGTTGQTGTVSGRGVFDLAAARGFGMDIRLQADRALLIARDDLRAQVTGPITIKSDGAGGTISGDLDIITGRFRLGSATAGAQVPQLPVRELNRPADEAPPPPPSIPWRLDLAVDARNRLTVTGLGLDSEWSANLKVGGTVTEPRINGRADLVRGSFDFAGRRFDLERGVITFLGESPINPTLDIVAEGGVQGVNAVIRVTGRGQQPEINFTSVPALPEDELLSRLLFGTSITNLSAPEALQLAAAVASLNSGGGPSLDPINAVRDSIGLDRLRIVPADVVTGQGTSIAAGEYIGRKVYVEVVTDGRGYSATQVEYQITRWLSLLATISTIGRESVNVRVSKDY